MSNIPEFLPNPSPDLGTSSTAIDRTSVDIQFKSLSGMPTTICMVCKQAATYRLIPKSGIYPNMELESRGYMCSHHVQSMDNTIWGIRPLGKSNQYSL